MGVFCSCGAVREDKTVKQIKDRLKKNRAIISKVDKEIP